MRAATLLCLLLLLPGSLAAQRTSAEPSRRAQLEARRDSLERVVVQKFVDRLTRELRMDAGQRAGTERVLEESGVRRRELMRQSSALRARIHRAARNAGTTDAEFARLLADHDALRTREHELWRQEQEELSRILTPRQRVQFIVAWARFQDDMREIISRRMREQDPPRDSRTEGAAPRRPQPAHR